MMRQQIERPFDPPLFRCAIFICSSLPWSADYTNGVDVTPLLLRHKWIPTDISELNAQLKQAVHEKAYDPTMDTDHGVPVQLSEIIAELSNESHDPQTYVSRKFHPEVDAARLPVPTAHIVGKEDEHRGSGLKLAEMCDKRYANLYEHKGGHEMPRTATDMQKIKDVILKTVTRSELVS